MVPINFKPNKSFTGTVYHGSGTLFEKFDQGKARIVNDYYGGGVAYFTDDFDVGITYAKSMSKKTKQDPIVYTVKLRLKKVFDVDDYFSGKDLTSILPANIEDFARGAGLMSLNADRYKVIYEIKSGLVNLTGDQVFRGLSRGMNDTAKARKHLTAKGYDGLRYNGGVNMGAKKHNVYLAYDANDIEITKKQMV